MSTRSIRAERVFITCADRPMDPAVSPAPLRILLPETHRSPASRVEINGALSIENLPRAFLSTFFTAASDPAGGTGQPVSGT